METVYRALRRYDGVRSVGGYIHTIARRTYAGYVDRKRRDAAVSLDDIPEPAADGPDDVETEDELRRVRQALAYLTRQRREIAYAYYFEDKPVAVIAAERGIPTGTVKWQLNKLRRELKENLYMEHNIGRLGLKPVRAVSIGHSGNIGAQGLGPEHYLGDRLNLNLVYSVYEQPRTTQEIADELGVNPVFLEERIEMLAENGFLVRQPGGRYTTYVRFWPETYSRQQEEPLFRKQQEAAALLVREYVPQVRAALRSAPPMYVPGGNRGAGRGRSALLRRDGEVRAVGARRTSRAISSVRPTAAITSSTSSWRQQLLTPTIRRRSISPNFPSAALCGASRKSIRSRLGRPTPAFRRAPAAGRTTGRRIMSICTNTSPARSATFPPTPKSSRGCANAGC